MSDVDHELQSTAWTIRSTINSTSKYSPSQIAFGTDMIFQAKVKVDWEDIKSRKGKVAEYNNKRENKDRIDHEYQVGDQILIIIKVEEMKAKLNGRTEGPYQVLNVFDNGTVKIRRDTYDEIINIRIIKQYNECVQVQDIILKVKIMGAVTRS